MPQMSKSQIENAVRGLRRTYGEDSVTCQQMVTHLGRIPGLPASAIKLAEAVFKNATKVLTPAASAYNRTPASTLSGNKAAKIALNAVVGFAKRGGFGG